MDSRHYRTNNWYSIVHLIVITFLIISHIIPTSATAGRLHGTVSLSGSPASRLQGADLNPYPATLGASPPSSGPSAGSPADVVLFIEGDFTGTYPKRPELRLTQINQSFQPRVLGVSVGTSVDFPNEDMIFHNVFSYSKAKKFDLGYYGNGKSKRVTFDKPGLVKVFCDIHANMSAYVLVVESPFVTQPQESGQYEMDGVPPGRYELVVWHPERGEKRHTITITDHATRVDLDL